jgi:hypothetical protein
MELTGEIVTVIGKGDLGWHPIHGDILEGKEYKIDSAYMTDELFILPTKTKGGSK